MTALIFATENETSINDSDCDKYETRILIREIDSSRNIGLTHAKDEIVNPFWIQLFFMFTISKQNDWYDR